MNTFLDKTGLQRLWGKIKALVPTKVSELENDSGYAPLNSPSFTGSPQKMSGQYATMHNFELMNKSNTITAITTLVDYTDAVDELTWDDTL